MRGDVRTRTSSEREREKNLARALARGEKFSCHPALRPPPGFRSALRSRYTFSDRVTKICYELDLYGPNTTPFWCEYKVVVEAVS